MVVADGAPEEFQVNGQLFGIDPLVALFVEPAPRAHSAHRVSCKAAWAGLSPLPLHQSKTRCKFSSSLALFLCSCGSGAGGACWRGIWAEASRGWQAWLQPVRGFGH